MPDDKTETPDHGRLRMLAWAIKELLVVLAVFSLVTWGWRHWIDLRFFGPVIEYGLPVLWTISLLVLHFAAGPRVVLGSMRLSTNTPAARLSQTFRWTNGTANKATCHALLFPTYMMLCCMAANWIYYVRMTRQDSIDSAFQLPTCALLIFIVAFWLDAFFKWRTISWPRLQPMTRSTAGWAAGWLLVCLLGCGWFFFLLEQERLPREPVDLAVVFGHRVMADETASDTLRSRTLAATDLYRRHLVKHILVSGELEGELSEAWAMRKVCLEEGVLEQDIFVDPLGNDTRDSVYHAKQLMAQQGWHSVVGASSGLHLLRITHTFADEGITAYTAAAHPAVWVPNEPFDIIRETIGVFVYWVNPHYHEAKAKKMNVQHPRIVVHKSKLKLELFDANRLVKTYDCFTGTHAGDKEREGDRKTPQGIYHIVYKNPESKFHLSLGLDYPNKEDAQRGLATGLLNQEQYTKLLDAIEHGDMTREKTQNMVWKTPLGGEIFIHGGADGRNPTHGSAGCVVVRNEDIDELYAICMEGTEVKIEP